MKITLKNLSDKNNNKSLIRHPFKLLGRNSLYGRESTKFFNKATAPVIVVVVAFAGVLSLLGARAAGFSVSIEPELGVLSGNVVTGSDPAASGGSYVQFGTSQSSNIAAPTNLVVTSNTAQQVNLSWQPSSTSGVTQYQILRNGTVLATINSDSTFGDGSVTASTTYTYSVKAIGAQGNSSPSSNTVTVTTPAPAQQPTAQLWSDPATWPNSQVPAPGSAVTISANSRVVFNVNTYNSHANKLNGITVSAGGELDIADQPVKLYTSYLVNFGKFFAGTDAHPLASAITIALDGNFTDDTIIGQFHSGANTLAAANGSDVEIHGTNTGIPWTKLASSSAVGNTSITLLQPVQWPVGSLIEIASGSRDPSKEERATITAVSADGKTLTLSSPLIYPHVSVVTSQTSNNQTRSVPEQDEVGLLTHNLNITGPDNAPQTFFGGHTVALNGSTFRISNTTLYHMGQMGILARYPLHWHMAGNASSSAVDNVSTYDDYNRYISLHATDYLHVNGLVGDNTNGHGIMFEDGDEQFSVVTNSLIMGVHRPPDDGNVTVKSTFPGDPVCTANNPIENGGHGPSPNSTCRVRLSDDNPSGIWVSNANNTLINNAVADTDGSGIWYDFNFNSDNTCLADPGSLPEETFTNGSWQATAADPGLVPVACGNAVASGPFAINVDNSAHSNLYPCDGQTINTAHANAVCANTSSPIVTTNCNSSGFCIEQYIGDFRAPRGIVNNPLTWMNDREAQWWDGTVTIDNPMAADNGTAMTNQSSYVTNGLLIGSGTGASCPTSSNCDHSWQNTLLRFYHGPSDVNGTWLAGYSTYADSPGDASNVAAINDPGASTSDGPNRVKSLVFFDHSPNPNNAAQRASYRVGYSNNGCYWSSYGGLNQTGHDHWFTDLDGSVIGNGVPEFYSNNSPFLRPVNGITTFPDSNGNTTQSCTGGRQTLGMDGGVPIRTGGQSILNPNTITGDTGGAGTFFNGEDSGFYNPFIHGAVKFLYPSSRVDTITRDSDGMIGCFENYANSSLGCPGTGENITSLSNNQSYLLSTSTNSAYTSQNFQIESSNVGWYQIRMKWSGAAVACYRTFAGPHQATKYTSLSALNSATNSGYFFDTANSMLYIRGVINGTEAPFGEPGNFSNMSQDGLAYEYTYYWKMTQTLDSNCSF
jgi:hypothetical protein